MQRLFKLTLFLGHDTASVWNSGEGQLTLGADPSCDLVLHVGGAHPKHATVCLMPDRLLVEDHATSIGTFVNGYQISERVEVEYPASVQIGETTLMAEFAESEAAAPEEASASLSDFPRGRPAIEAAGGSEGKQS